MVPKVTAGRTTLFSIGYVDYSHKCAIVTCKHMHTEPKRLRHTVKTLVTRLGGNPPPPARTSTLAASSE
jgi:hypothetical protein